MEGVILVSFENGHQYIFLRKVIREIEWVFKGTKEQGVEKKKRGEIRCYFYFFPSDKNESVEWKPLTCLAGINQLSFFLFFGRIGGTLKTLREYLMIVL